MVSDGDAAQEESSIPPMEVSDAAQESLIPPMEVSDAAQDESLVMVPPAQIPWPILLHRLNPYMRYANGAPDNVSNLFERPMVSQSDGESSYYSLLRIMEKELKIQEATSSTQTLSEEDRELARCLDKFCNCWVGSGSHHPACVESVEDVYALLRFRYDGVTDRSITAALKSLKRNSSSHNHPLRRMAIFSCELRKILSKQ